MRILFVNQRAYLPQLMGGVEQTTFDLGRQLTQMRHQTAVMCGLVRGDATWLRNRLGSRLTRRGFPRGRYLGSPVYRGYDPRAGFEEVLADFHPDGLVIAGGTNESFELAAQSARTGLHSIYYFHDLVTLRRLQTPELLAGLALVANSAYTAGVVREILGRECLVIPPLIDRAAYRTMSAPSERRHVTMVNPRRVKGGQTAFELAQACPDIPFVFVEAWGGDNAYVQSLRAAARGLPNVTWYRPTTDMRRIYATTRILLVPSDLEETWGRVASEAHVSGIPVLARAVAALPESVGPGGMLIEPQAPIGEWIRALRSMWEDGALYETLSVRAREYSERANAQPEHLAEAFVAALQSPMAGATSPPHGAAAATDVCGIPSMSTSLQQAFVTIVTPVYNGEAYLRECIESVLAQTWQNWEYVILNNASTDGSLAIANEYAARDARIRVHSNPHTLPMMQNHNAALRLMSAQAQYCKPLMADDWLYPECIEKMVSCAQAQPSIGLVCAYALTGVGILFQGVRCAGSPTTFLSGRAACRLSLLGDSYFFGSPTTMLIRSDLIRKRNPFYNPVNLHADEESGYDILQESDFGFVHQVLSFFRIHEHSQTWMARQFESIFVGRVYALAKYGHAYLTDEEFERRYRERFNEYYDLLAAAALQARGRDFWEYHRAKLALLETPLDRPRLARAIARHALRRLASPGSLAESVRTWWLSGSRRHRKLDKESTNSGGRR